jgi:Protein of unknown function DUF262/Protein of unknown function (DUF1524)
MIIDSKPWQIGALLEGKYFQIPRYQRPYLWERAHLDDFWRDVIQSRGDEEYFIGSIVTAKPRHESVYAVVDGQQRLTTITILLCVLRDAFEEAGDADLAEGTHTLIERRNRENKLQFVLTTETSYPFLQEHIQRRDDAELETIAGPEEEALKAANEFFESRIGEVVDSVRTNSSLSGDKQKKEIVKRLRTIRDQVLSLQVIFVELENEDDAYLVFETLNTRGKDLRATDLVKNLVLRLKRPTNKGVDVAKEKWNTILETLEESEASIRVDAFLHHSWLSRNDFVAQKKLFMAVKGRVTKSNVDGYLNELVSDAALYRILHEPEFRDKKWQQQEFGVRNAIDGINHFGIRLSVPVILALLRDWEDGALNLAPVRDTMIALESFHFIFNAVTEQRATGGLAMMFASLARDLFRSKPKDKPAMCGDIRKKLRERLPDIETFKLGFKNIVYTKSQTKHKNLVKYVLARVAQYNNWPIDRKETTIEHLKPQSSGLPDAVVGQMGNLLLVPPKLNNEKLGNKTVAQKKQILKKAKFPIPDAMESYCQMLWTSG